MNRVFVVLVFLSVLFVFVMGVKLLCRQVVFSCRAIRVSGTVARYQERESVTERGSKLWYAEVVSFDWNGTKREVVSSVSSDTPGHAVGQKRQVAVNPNNADDVSVVSFWNWVTPFLVIGCGGVLFVLGFALCAMLCPSFLEDLRFLLTHSKLAPALLTAGAAVIRFFMRMLLYSPVLIALFFVGMGAWLLYSHIAFFQKAIMVPGILVRYQERTEYDRDSNTEKRLYTGVFAYSFDGEKREITSKFSSSSMDSADIGKPCRVGINPQNTCEARIYSKGELAIAVGLMGAGGVILLFFLFRRFFS